ncbi:MAG: NFACT family protein [Candidatus Tectimicrobiota bacterium]
MDIFVLKALVDGLRPQLRGAVVSKVFQMSPHDLLLRLWNQQDRRLLLSTQPREPRLHLTASRWRNPARPPRFAAFLRAHLSQVRLADITVRPYDRVVALHWERPGASAPALTLVHELYGQQSNILLLDDAGMILDALTYRPAATRSPRSIMPGQLYQALPQPDQRLLLSQMSLATLEELAGHGTLTAQGLQRLLVGLSPLLAVELIHRSQGQPRPCWELLQALQAQYDQATLRLSLCTTASGQQYLSPLPLTHCAGSSVLCEQAQEAVTALYDPFLDTMCLDELRTTLRHTVSQRLQKLRTKIANLAQDRSRLEQYLAYQHYGTLLVSQRIPRGTAEISLVDYYSSGQDTITIRLDPRLSVQDNAQVYFKKYRKARSGLSKVQAFLAQCAQEAAALERLAQQLTVAPDWETLETLAQGLQQGPVAPPARARTPVPAKSALPYRTFVLRDGFTLYCGKSDQGNEAVLRQLAGPEDIWLHAHRQAGAHVVLKVRPEHEVPAPILHQAAALAAFYSKGKEAGSVEVMYTQAKHVHKFRGARPGQVQVTDYRTLHVTPQLPAD